MKQAATRIDPYDFDIEVSESIDLDAVTAGQFESETGGETGDEIGDDAGAGSLTRMMDTIAAEAEAEAEAETAAGLGAEQHALPPEAADPDLDDATIDALDSARIPHINIDVYYETDGFAQVWDRTGRDRHMATTTLRHAAGGFRQAVRSYARSKTPDLIILETCEDENGLELQLDALAEVCDPDTRLILVGHCNDIGLYRRLIDMGVSNYLVWPIAAPDLITAISDVFAEPGHEKIGRVTAVIGAKGGVGASSVAQNLALDMSVATDHDVLLVDMDTSFGTASMNLDVEPNQGLVEIVDQAERLDAAILDRVLIKRGAHLNLLSTTPSLESDLDIDEFAVEKLLDVAASHIAHIVLDLPHTWSPWMRRAMAIADRTLVVATPEICCLRNAATLMTQLKALRPNDLPPTLVINQVGMPGRQEMTQREIVSVLKAEGITMIPYDAKTFNKAASTGKMLAEVAPKRPVVRAIASLKDKILTRQNTKAKRARRRRRLFG